MKRQSIYEYFKFGTGFRYLQDAREGYPVHSEAGVMVNLRHFFSRLDDLGLSVTKRLTKKLRVVCEELEATDKPSRLSKAHATRINREIADIRRTLMAEMQGVHAFSVTPKVIDTTRLLEDVPALFGTGVFAWLPDIAKYDLTEAARCIAFNRSTAAAFHLLRGTEMALRTFYCAVVKQKRIKSRMWGPLVTDLRSKPKAAKHELLLNHLDHIRHAFRNPTQHPEKIYDIQEAQDLWSLCADAINRMQRASVAP